MSNQIVIHDLKNNVYMILSKFLLALILIIILVFLPFKNNDSKLLFVVENIMNI